MKNKILLLAILFATTTTELKAGGCMSCVSKDRSMNYWVADDANFMNIPTSATKTASTALLAKNEIMKVIESYDNQKQSGLFESMNAYTKAGVGNFNLADKVLFINKNVSWLADLYIYDILKKHSTVLSDAFNAGRNNGSIDLTSANYTNFITSKNIWDKINSDTLGTSDIGLTLHNSLDAYQNFDNDFFRDSRHIKNITVDTILGSLSKRLTIEGQKAAEAIWTGYGNSTDKTLPGELPENIDESLEIVKYVRNKKSITALADSKGQIGNDLLAAIYTLYTAKNADGTPKAPTSNYKTDEYGLETFLHINENTNQYTLSTSDIKRIFASSINKAMKEKDSGKAFEILHKYYQVTKLRPEFKPTLTDKDNKQYVTDLLNGWTAHQAALKSYDQEAGEQAVKTIDNALYAYFQEEKTAVENMIGANFAKVIAYQVGKHTSETSATASSIADAFKNLITITAQDVEDFINSDDGNSSLGIQFLHYAKEMQAPFVSEKWIDDLVKGSTLDKLAELPVYKTAKDLLNTGLTLAEQTSLKLSQALNLDNVIEALATKAKELTLNLEDAEDKAVIEYIKTMNIADMKIANIATEIEKNIEDKINTITNVDLKQTLQTAVDVLKEQYKIVNDISTINLDSNEIQYRLEETFADGLNWFAKLFSQQTK